MTVSDPCVTLSTGTLSPDLRVNYTRGMVLGVDEFLQEQTYFLQKDYLHERALHGYGTVSGLHVSVTPAGDDYTVQVGRGIGIDRWGREFVLRCAQCANLGAWLATQETVTPGTIARNAGPSGELTVHVVANYDTCLDDLVPLPGQPCSSSAQTSVASRIRDAWDVELRWAPPEMPEWDADRRLARLLDSVEIVAGLDPADSDEDAIIAEVLSLPDADFGVSGVWPPDLDWPYDGVSGATGFRLPAATAADALDRIFTAWVTQARPRLLPELESPDPASDPAILLATITFSPAAPFSVAAPVITSCADPDDTDRPVLLHTRLIQELQRLTGATSSAPPQQLVTLNPMIDAHGKLTSVSAAFHLDRPVSLTDVVAVRSSNGWRGDFRPMTSVASGFTTLWSLVPPAGFTAAEGDILEMTFDGTAVAIGVASDLLSDALAGGLNVLDATPDGDVRAYAGVQIAPAQHPAPPPPPAPAPAPSKEFVTITQLPGRKDQFAFEMWFHPEPVGARDDAIIRELDVKVFDERTGDELNIASGPQPDPNYGNVWRVAVERPEELPAYLRLLFIANETLLKTPDGDLRLSEWIDDRKIEFIGFDPDELIVVAFARFAVPLLADQ